MEPTSMSIDAAVMATLSDATAAELEALDAHLGREWSRLSEARVAVGQDPAAPFVVHRATGEDRWFPVGSHRADTSMSVVYGPPLLATLDAAATAVLEPTSDVHGLAVFAFFRVVEGDPQSGEISLDAARRENPSFVVGDELGRHQPELTERLRWVIVRGLREHLPLTIEDDSTPSETIRAALAEEAGDRGQTRRELARELVAQLGVPLAGLDPDTARLALDAVLRGQAPTLAPLTPARAAALVAELEPLTAQPPAEDETHTLSTWEQERFDALQELEDEARRAELETLAKHRDADPIWHVLAAHAQARPEDLTCIEALLESWSDGACVMPRAWFASIRAGRFAAHHRLVRQLVLEGAEAALLHMQGVEASLAGLRGLGLRRLDDEALERVFALGWLNKLRALHLLDLDGPTLASADAFPVVEDLQVHRGHHRPEDLADLIVAPSFPSLATLHLFGVGVGLGSLARALGERRLARAPFSLRMTSLPDVPGLVALTEAPAVHGLAGLELIGIELDPAHALALAAAPLTLRELVLHIGTLGPVGADALASASWWPDLETLSLPPSSGCEDAGVATMLSGLRAPRRLELRHQKLGSATATALADAELGALEHLELSNNPLADADLASVLRNPSLRSLRRLSLLRTGAGPETFEALAAGSFRELEVLEVGDAVSDEAATQLERAELPRLKRLQLRGASDGAMARLQRAGAFVTNAMFA